ncbi:putative ABC transporter permease [Eggerthia catenaformis]|uniref:putative ABC transporter permease n=1 Tax=Eggerthia catenaformis TaxID=31973 RepID=UPI00248F0D2E|nr:putative ABC transporter permease [Eggerthia catenaformis]
MIISRYFIGFVFFSFLGWVWECLFCMINTGKWENRGFLFGPYCPIYGSAVMLAYFIFGHHRLSVNSSLIIVFLICMIGSAVIEYVTSYILEKIYHARWWDYSNIPFNIKGRIALPISVAFGIAGIIIVKFVFPIVNNHFPPHHSLFAESLSLLLMGLISVDLGVTLSTLSEVVYHLNMTEKQLGNRIQWIYDRVGEETEELREQWDNYSNYITIKISQVAESINRREWKSLKKMTHFTTNNQTYIVNKLKKLKDRMNKK